MNEYFIAFNCINLGKQMIRLTESAAHRIREMVAKKKSVIGLRMGVTQSGFSGYRYALDFAKTIVDDDTVIEQNGVTLIVDKTSFSILNNLELDFVKNGLNQSFKFNNPNAVSSCGCGESFSVAK